MLKIVNNSIFGAYSRRVNENLIIFNSHYLFMSIELPLIEIQIHCISLPLSQSRCDKFTKKATERAIFIHVTQCGISWFCTSARLDIISFRVQSPNLTRLVSESAFFTEHDYFKLSINQLERLLSLQTVNMVFIK